MKESNMKKNTATRTETWEMRKEYGFSNVHPKKYAEGANIVVIEPDLVKFSLTQIVLILPFVLWSQSFRN
ncbi:MAG: hypothetical protein ONB46_09850 [candidate division KSB1 bacterium]|nr:hypothetical protein [candidate division KSB1 bacterium]MDZ7366106.1 hypothetical protein [candidate division KSB1 bacterium]MDZ7404252.1 hypothetical protein [candidate division KSB1 bacterium]